MTIRAPPRKEKERQAMRAVFSNLEDAYEAGYADGMAEIRKRYRRRQERKARRWYFIKQKLYGVALLIATVFAVWVLDEIQKVCSSYLYAEGSSGLLRGSVAMPPMAADIPRVYEMPEK